MRKIILSLAVSLDVFIAREDGAVDWLHMEDLTEAADESRKFFKTIDTIFFGRKTFEKGFELGGDLKMYGNVKLSFSPEKSLCRRVNMKILCLFRKM